MVIFHSYSDTPKHLSTLSVGKYLSGGAKHYMLLRNSNCWEIPISNHRYSTEFLRCPMCVGEWWNLLWDNHGKYMMIDRRDIHRILQGFHSAQCFSYQTTAKNWVLSHWSLGVAVWGQNIFLDGQASVVCWTWMWSCFWASLYFRIFRKRDLGMNQYLLINTIFRGMNIHKSQLFWCSPGVQGFDTLPFQVFHLEQHVAGMWSPASRNKGRIGVLLLKRDMLKLRSAGEIFGFVWKKTRKEFKEVWEKPIELV